MDREFLSGIFTKGPKGYHFGDRCHLQPPAGPCCATSKMESPVPSAVGVDPHVTHLALDRKGMDRRHLEHVAGKFISDPFHSTKVPEMLKPLVRLPTMEPDGALIGYRERRLLVDCIH